MYITLEDKDLRVIANKIFEKECVNNESTITDYIIIDDLELEIKFNKEIEGYYEDEYENGTGSWVTTRAIVTIHDISACDLNINVDYDKNSIESMAEDLLTL